MFASLLTVVTFLVRLSHADAPETTAKATLHHFDLQKRVLTSICGYGIEDPTYTFVCDVGGLCGFNSASKAFGCCGSTSGASLYDCYFPTICYDYGKLTVVPSGSAAYFTYSCSNIAYPYCATIYESGMSNFDCNEYKSQTQFLNFLANTSTVITSSPSGSSRGSSFLSSASSGLASTLMTASNSLTPLSSGSTAVVVGPTSTAPSFSRSQATGSTTPTTTTSVGHKLEADNWVRWALVVSVSILTLR